MVSGFGANIDDCGGIVGGSGDSNGGSNANMSDFGGVVPCWGLLVIGPWRKHG